MRELNIFTHSFPYGKGEQFLYEEVLILSKSFDKINLFPANSVDNVLTWSLPENIFIYNFEIKNEKIHKTKNIGLVAKALLTEFKNGTHFRKYLKKLRYFAAHLSNAHSEAQTLLTFFTRSNVNLNSIFYTYWFNDWTYRLVLLKYKKHIKHLVTRIHGGDVYEYQHADKTFFFPFRNFQIQQINKIFPVSQDGSDHLKRIYPASGPKLKLARLGTKDHGSNPIKTSKEEFVLVSCSTFYHYKNVGLIPEILSFLKFPIRWVHIGNEGPEKEAILNSLKNLPPHVTIEFKGHLKQEELFDFYRNTFIDLFINVSKSEGLPVSLMEAISFGIPIMAPNVGGIREITNSRTGVLFDINSSPEKIAETITSIHNGQVLINRNEVRKFWEENFMAQKNYASFSEELKLVAN